MCVPLFDIHIFISLSLALTWEADSVHLVSMVTSQGGVEALEVRVAFGDDSRGLVTTTRLHHMDGVELQTHINKHRHTQTHTINVMSPTPSEIILVCFSTSFSTMTTSLRCPQVVRPIPHPPFPVPGTVSQLGLLSPGC